MTLPDQLKIDQINLIRTHNHLKKVFIVDLLGFLEFKTNLQVSSLFLHQSSSSRPIILLFSRPS